MPSICAGPLSSSYLTSSCTPGRSIFPSRSQMAKVKGPSSLTVRCTSVTVVTLETVWLNLCSARPRHNYSVFYEQQHILSHISWILDPPAIFLAFCCTLLRLTFYFEPCSILRLSGPQYWLKSSFLVPQKPFRESLSYFTTKKMGATREETRETQKVTNVTVSHFGGKARKTSK
jgi:hypothetical protein